MSKNKQKQENSIGDVLLKEFLLKPQKRPTKTMKELMVGPSFVEKKN